MKEKTKTTLSESLKRNRHYFILSAIILLGLFLRLYQIETLPPGVFPDEAVNGEDAIHANLNHQYELFYPANEGREGLFINIIALFFKFFGISLLTLKLPAIIFSSLAIWGTYLLTKQLIKIYIPRAHPERTALISAFLVSVSYWSINFARISFRANMLPAILVFSFFFLFLGIAKKKYYPFIISGIIFGLGAHTYIAWRIAPAILLIFFLILTFFRKNFLKEYWKFLIIFFLFSTLVAWPIFHDLYFHAEHLHAPIDDIYVFSPVANHGHPIKALLKSFFLSLAKYNFWGDQNWRHNYPPYPILDPLSGAAFLFGLIYSLIKLIDLVRLKIIKNVEKKQIELYFFLLLWFFAMLAPEFLSAEGNPHALRAIGTLPVVFIFGALTFEYGFLRIASSQSSKRRLATVLIALSLIFIGLFNPIKYFFFWSNQTNVAKSFDENLTLIARFLKTLPAEEEKFVVSSFGPYHSPLDRLPIQIFSLDIPNVTYLYSWQNFDQIRPKSGSFTVILTGLDNDTETRLKERFPDLKLEKIANRLGSTYYILQQK